MAVSSLGNWADSPKFIMNNQAPTSKVPRVGGSIFYISGAIQGTDSQVQKMAVGQMVWILPAVWSNMLSAGLRTNLRDPEMLLGA